MRLAAVSVMFFTESSMIFCSYSNASKVWSVFCVELCWHVLDYTTWEAKIKSIPTILSVLFWKHLLTLSVPIVC